MPETPLERVIEEEQFAAALSGQADSFFRLRNTLLSIPVDDWNRKHFFQLLNEANDLESYLDDYGARYNKAYSFFTEAVASIRGLSQVCSSVSHLIGRVDSYGIREATGEEKYERFVESARFALSFVRGAVRRMLSALGDEAEQMGVEITSRSLDEKDFESVRAKLKLPRNVGQDDISDERQKIAEVASKFIQACDMLDAAKITRIDDAEERRKVISQICTEEQARVYEATVHNLQSAYDTYIKNTRLESEDPDLPHLRGYASVALHLLEAVTDLTHFYERHENDVRSEAAKARIAELADRSLVQEVILNHLLVWARHFMDAGRSVAGGLLREYTNVQELEAVLDDDLVLHARPAALIVGIVTHYGTPVELEVNGQRCNAGSILELLVTVGSHPEQRRYVFRGDENPLRDIALLFQYGLGESGIDDLPGELAYLAGEVGGRTPSRVAGCGSGGRACGGGQQPGLPAGELEVPTRRKVLAASPRTSEATSSTAATRSVRRINDEFGGKWRVPPRRRIARRASSLVEEHGAGRRSRAGEGPAAGRFGAELSVSLARWSTGS